MQSHLAGVCLPLALALSAGCGPEVAGELGSGTDQQALSSDNGFSLNGLSQNGLSQNGLSQNGLSQNGFSTWFNRDAKMGDTVMRYLVKCAVASGLSRTWTNPATGVSYTWPGDLGLAPSWAGGMPANLLEQQVITACLAAHVNKYGVNVPIAVEGRTATGVQIPVGANELTTYSQTEAAFFGNLFTSEGIFVCEDHGDFVNYTAKSSIRACAFDRQSVGPSTVCPPLYFAGNNCRSFCQRNASKPLYDSCTWNGVTYQPLTTRFKKEDIYTCGDGVCQLTEHCGTGTTPASCKADCGLCP
jgi:hypothetical protein